LDLQELVAQLQIHEQLVVTLALLAQEQLVQEHQVQEPQLVVAPLELVELPCLPKNFGAQKKLAQKNLRQPENLAYLF
jgi:hypothetical protein